VDQGGGGGDGRPFVAAFINIDLEAVGDWAERRNLAYASYQELAAEGAVYDLVQGCIEQVNRDLAAEPALAPSQIRRFLILHKELDADDGELHITTGSHIAKQRFGKKLRLDPFELRRRNMIRA
jgi:long-subunit acyl-CoA synthetase (AMP-forming)